MKIWKIITDLTAEESDHIDDIFDEESGDIIRSLDTENEIYSWDLIDGDIYIPYLICTEEIIDILTEISHKHGVEFDAEDITEEFLLGMHVIPDSDFDQYRADNLTEDLVYEKLKRFGKDSLDEIDKQVLENC